MEKSKVKMVGFRRLQQPPAPEVPLSFERPKINIVLVDLLGSETEKEKLR